MVRLHGRTVTPSPDSQTVLSVALEQDDPAPATAAEAHCGLGRCARPRRFAWRARLQAGQVRLPAHGAGRNVLSRTVPSLALLDIKGHRMTEPSTSWQLEDITYSGGTQDGPRANVKLSRAEQEVHAEGSGTGLIDAVCQS